MMELDFGQDREARERIASLEARVVQLERALANLATRVGAVPAPAQAPSRAPVARPPAPPVVQAAPVRAPASAPAQVRPVTAAPLQAPIDRAETRVTLDRLGITAAFEQLDVRLAEAAAQESAFVRGRGSDAPVIHIDESLIETSTARPPAEKLEVLSGMEELYPKILARIAMTWRTPEAVDYLKKLIVDERGGRAGFPMEVMSELLMLSSVLEAGAGSDRWAANARLI